MLARYCGDLRDDRFKAANRGFLLSGQWALRPEMSEHDEQRVLDAAKLLAELATSVRTSSSTAGFEDCPSSMLTSPTWLPTGLKNQVQGLIVCVTLPASGNRKIGMVTYN